MLGVVSIYRLTASVASALIQLTQIDANWEEGRMVQLALRLRIPRILIVDLRRVTTLVFAGQTTAQGLVRSWDANCFSRQF